MADTPHGQPGICRDAVNARRHLTVWPRDSRTRPGDSSVAVADADDNACATVRPSSQPRPRQSRQRITGPADAATIFATADKRTREVRRLPAPPRWRRVGDWPRPASPAVARLSSAGLDRSTPVPSDSARGRCDRLARAAVDHRRLARSQRRVRTGQHRGLRPLDRAHLMSRTRRALPGFAELSRFSDANAVAAHRRPPFGCSADAVGRVPVVARQATSPDLRRGPRPRCGRLPARPQCSR